MPEPEHGVKERPLPDLSGMTLAALSDWVTSIGLPPFRAGQLFRWIHGRLVKGFDEMTDISKSLRGRLSEEARITRLQSLETHRSEDGTLRAVLALPDGLPVETVLIPEPRRLTACLSTQVGCRMGCAFCQTGRLGLLRDLSTSEIVAQLDWLRGLPDCAGNRVSNVVLMGMGEPLDNRGQVFPALEIITGDLGASIASRRVTVSTIGLTDGIAEMEGLPGQYGLALSLHGALPETRARLVPGAPEQDLDVLAASLASYARVKRRRVTIEYCLIEGVNDDREHADALAAFTGRIPCKINVIPLNPVGTGGLRPPAKEGIERFLEWLYPVCQAVILRKPRGRDIQGACGQLGTSLLLASRGYAPERASGSQAQHGADPQAR
ncbi:23S rRNA (adenine(2503)-C(2))-methyltransferase RlmN [Candidatus Fermentibacterales bacterium]|nr:23S rRNA (adenine(2503)-C(2))-methyltransferase RlmN [Candidatus Fermentibacterales bacterium]